MSACETGGMDQPSQAPIPTKAGITVGRWAWLGKVKPFIMSTKYS